MSSPIPVRIVCTHDALRTAEDMRRRLSAEQHPVAVNCGRQSLANINVAKDQREAVILIWSDDAQSAHYMHKWASDIEPSRLIEVSRTSSPPRFSRRAAQVIDFTRWSGEGGGAAWRAVEERLRSVIRATEPAKPPPLRAAIALVAVSVVAVGEAAVMRMHDGDHVAQAAAPQPDEIAQVITVHPGPSAGASDLAEGGPLVATEPASQPDELPTEIYRPRRRFATIDAVVTPDSLRAMRVAPSMEFRNTNPGLLGRLSSLAAPLIRRSDETRIANSAP